MELHPKRLLEYLALPNTDDYVSLIVNHSYRYFPRVYQLKPFYRKSMDFVCQVRPSARRIELN